VTNTNITESQFVELCQITQQNPKIMNSSDLLKINRSVSYMTFILKELVDYCIAKSHDGTPLFKLRVITNEYKAKKSVIDKFNSFIIIK